MKFDPARHLIVCVDQDKNHFHLSMPEFSAAEAQFEQQPGPSAPEPVDLSPLYDRIAGLEQALAEALRLMEARASTPAPADELIVPTSWPVAASDVVIPAPPRHETRPTMGRRGDWKAAAAAVEQAEDFDAPLPAYVPPPEEPTAADVFTAEPAALPIRQKLREAVKTARESLIEDRTMYDVAVMAVNHNEEQGAKLKSQAKRRGMSVVDVATEIIVQWRACEKAFTDVNDINESALEAMTDNPGDAERIVRKAIAQINRKVGDATAYRA